MLEPWNNASILPPPVNMFLSGKKVDITALKHICNNIIKVLSKQSPLHKESALCSRFLYKYDTKFRNDIGYRNFKKVHTALKKYLALNLLKDVESFLTALPSENDDEKYLPTRQMLEFLMLRIITFSMIMLRICICSKQAAIFYLNRIRRGESHWMSLLPYALLSRLWSMTMVLVQHSTNWYSNLYPYLDKLELKGLRFLPDNYELPEDLEQWLDLKNIDNFGRFDWDQRKIIAENNLTLDNDDEESDLFDNILNFVNQSNVNELDEEETLEEEIKPIDNSKDLYIKPIVESTTLKIDQGEVLSRDSYKIDHGTVISRESLQRDQGEALSRESFKLLLNTQSNKSKVLQQQLNRHLNEKNKPAKQNKVNPNKIAKQQQQVDSKEIYKINQQDNEHSYEKGANDTSFNEQNSSLNNKIVKGSNKKMDAKECKETSEDTNKHIQDNNGHSYKLVTNTSSLKQFIKREEKYRNNSDNRSLTDHLSLMQWHALKNASLKLCDALTNRKVEKKFQKIWHQKCLDYK